MRRIVSFLLGVTLVVGVCAAGASPAMAGARGESGTQTLLVTSGPAWQTWHDGRFVGDAQNYCLNADYPSPCPPGATIYGFAAAGWTADLSSIPGATWIWAPGITGGTPNASGASYTFKRRFTLHGPVVTGTLYVAADDWARVNVNGTWVASYGSVTNLSEADYANSHLSQGFDIAPYLTQGVNQISVWDENGPDWFAGCSSPCDYARNPAGVAFGLRMTVQHSPATPSARAGAAVTYDPLAHEVIMFGGSAGGQVPLGDTWAWNGKRWRELHPATSPPARYLASMAYDAATKQVVLFGGGDCYGCFLNGTWTWNGSTWTKRHPVTSPLPRQQAMMAYDAATKQIVLFGGAGAGTDFSGTWTWNGTNWIKRNPPHHPGLMNGSAMTYDPVSARLLLFGGWDGSQEVSDTWAWNGTDWTHLQPQHVPPARGNTSMVFDAAEGRVVLFAGNSGYSALDDMWVWTGSDWTQLLPTALPPARVDYAMAYDESSEKILVFGGSVDYGGSCLSDTWTWHRPWTAWVQHTHGAP